MNNIYPTYKIFTIHKFDQSNIDKSREVDDRMYNYKLAGSPSLKLPSPPNLHTQLFCSTHCPSWVSNHGSGEEDGVGLLGGDDLVGLVGFGD